jgi:hypothetical protein
MDSKLNRSISNSAGIKEEGTRKSTSHKSVKLPGQKGNGIPEKDRKGHS